MNLFKQIIAVSLTSLFFSGTIYAGEKEVPQFIEGTTRINASELVDLVEKYEDLVIIDARKKSDVAKGFIEGSISLPNTETSGASLAKHIPSKSHPIAIYCNGAKCGRSVKSAKIAIAEGYTNIFWFRGGIEAWENENFPVVRP